MGDMRRNLPMKGSYKTALVFVGPLLLAKGLDAFLKSASGRRLAARTGNDVLATREGREIAKKYTGVAAGVVTGALGAKKAGIGDGLRTIARPEGANWLGVAEDTAAILLAVGGLLKAVSDFAREKRKAAQRSASARAL
jgi:hypothetical protein